MEISSWGKTYKIVRITCEKYGNNKNLAVQLWCEDEEYGGIEPFATLTVNLGKLDKENLAFIDTNNCPWAEEFIAKYHLGKSTGTICRSGFCTYPLYEMNLKMLEKYGEVAA